MDAPAILTALRTIAVPEKAVQMAAYMKNRFTFLGVATPERRQIGKPYLRADKGRAVDWAFIDTCWASPYREMQYIAADYLHAKQKQLTAADIPRLQTLISRNAWWDSVDSFIRPLGDILRRCPGGIWGIALPMFLVFSMNGIIAACANAAALASVEKTVGGAAAALIGALQYGSGIVSSLLLAAFSDGTPRAMTGLIALFVGLSALMAAGNAFPRRAPQ